MPSTITAYNTFIAGTKAKAAEVNTNFSNHRGTRIPIEENTAAGSNHTHNLGALDHFWEIAYIRNVTFGLTTTALFPFSANTDGSLNLGDTGTSFNAQFNLQTTTVQYDFAVNGSTAASIDQGGLKEGSFNDDSIDHRHLKFRSITTTGGTIGTFIFDNINGVSTSSTTFTRIATIDLRTGGRPLKFELAGDRTAGQGIIQVVTGATIVATYNFRVVLETTTSTILNDYQINIRQDTAASQSYQNYTPPSGLTWRHFQGPTSSSQYHLEVHVGGAATNLGFFNIDFLGYEE